ncbi:uncharacterized protein LOC120188362 isoform X2 [Hibiscus syriacus]|uniref:uncharacterized protein LOC120188362 isoform X2 n=1 Tax=Hibiscus syriacus TaxID=106335 RepID=UPI00192398CA|nr:uncharacterized protein LOC120188362 isoform X2 [Hibiscus syriacus]
MIMVPAENLSKRNHLPRHGGDGLDIYGCSGGSCAENLSLRRYGYQSEACLGSVGANHMADDASRTNSLNEVGSSSKDYNHQEEEEGDKGWLQLSIGGYHATRNHHAKLDHGDHGRGLTGFNLLPRGGSHRESPHMPEFRAPIHPLVMQGFATSLFLQQQEEGSSSNTFKPIAAAASSSSLVPSGSYFTGPFRLQPGIDVAGPNSDVRIIDPPRRPHSGIWFMLQASENQAKEPFLPQIPKCYLRIKDGKMTVRSVMKYLVNKLNLDSESEVEIRCREEELQPSLTLQHVRDEIWSNTSRDGVALLPHTSTPPHHPNLMLLHYGRKA